MAQAGHKSQGSALRATGTRRAMQVFATCVLMPLSGCHFHSGAALPAPGTAAYARFSKAFYEGLAGLQIGDDARAASQLKIASELVPGEPAAWADWGVLALRQRDFDAAAERLGKAHALAPDDGRIDFLLGLVKSSQGDSAGAIEEFRSATARDPKNLRALYRMAQETEQGAAPGSDAQVQSLLRQILSFDPHNTAALVDLCRIAAKQGDATTLHGALAQLAVQSTAWPADVRAQFAELQAAAAEQPRAAATRSVFLRNVLMQVPSFRVDLLELAAQPGEDAEPIERFLRLATPPSQPSPADTGLHYTNEAAARLPGGAWAWAGALQLNGQDAPTPAVADAAKLQLANGVNLLFPAGGGTVLPNSVLAFDFNYDFKNDLLLVNARGLKLYRQADPSHFTDVTGSLKLPGDVLRGSYTGAWAADVEADGDLDVVLGTRDSEPVVLQNNGDGTFTPIHTLRGIRGLQQFAWADLNGDGNPDIALIDGSGDVHVLLNQRSGHFEETQLPLSQMRAAAIAIGDTGRDGYLRLHILGNDGSIHALHWNPARATWTAEPIAEMPPLASDGAYTLQCADLDNNGAVDLAVLHHHAADNGTGNTAQILLQDADGTFHPATHPPQLAQAFLAADLHNEGQLDIAGLNAQGTFVDARMHGTRNYGWQTIRPRARQTTGDQRVNPFGIGGEIEVRSGLLLEQQPIDGPSVHFGLGDRTGVDVARIVWPNGTVRAEFGLKANQQVVTEQRLKGSCPFLFAWNGKQMAFVKDSVPWGSAIGLRIDGLGTARIAATEEWYKIRGDQLQPRNGYYDLRVTGELWESYFYDSLALMTVDHPVGTEVFVDERFDVPPVKLGVTVTAEPQPIARATDDLGNDVTATLAAADGRYLDTFGRGQYQGITRDHSVEIDLGKNLPATGPVWLIAKGWLHPSDSTVNVAMSQGAHPKPEWLQLEVADGKGGWRVARRNLGFPAGRNKTCLLDISGLFATGAPHRLRLRTNLEIYWDQVQWAQGLPGTPLHIHRIDPSYADLHYRGFSAIDQANASSPELPEYNRIASTTAQWNDLPGFYTRYGDVVPLLRATDDRYVIMNAGDELSLRFQAPQPAGHGWVRDYVIAGDGWIKDGDYNSAESATLLPYPYHARRDYDSAAGPLSDDWEYQHHRDDWETYQTRYVDGDRFRNALPWTTQR